MSDALDIARWCWPEDEPWRMTMPDTLPDSAAMSSGMWFDPRRMDDDRLGACHGVRAAELVLIERGLQAEYGAALLDALDGADLHAGGGRYDLDAYWIARIAHAPPEARVRALAAVIRAQR